jgi:hypothetical protein
VELAVHSAYSPEWKIWNMWETLDQALLEPRMRITFGVFWIVAGIGWLVRSSRNEANPAALYTLLSAPESKNAKQRGWETGTGVALIALGVFYTLAACFSDRW